MKQCKLGIYAESLIALVSHLLVNWEKAFFGQIARESLKTGLN